MYAELVRKAVIGYYGTITWRAVSGSPNKIHYQSRKRIRIYQLHARSGAQDSFLCLDLVVPQSN